MTPFHRLAVAAAALSAFAVSAEEAAPTPEEIRRVLDYQENGKDRGPILIELVPCLKVDTTKGSPTAFNCVDPVAGPVKKGTTVNAWMAWFCPKGGAYEDITVQFLHEGQVRQTVDLKVEGLSRTRTFRSHTLGKTGTWQIKIARGDRELTTATITVE